MAKLKSEEIKAIALEIANNHKTKKVVKKGIKPEDMDRHDVVPVKTVHVLMPSRGAFIDLTEEEQEKLSDYAMENTQSTHVFEHELEAEKVKAEKVKKD